MGKEKSLHSLKKNVPNSTSQKPSSQQSIYGQKCSSQTVISTDKLSSYTNSVAVDEQLKHIKPCKELQYYRRKMNDVMKEYGDMLDKVESLKELCSVDYKQRQELQRRDNEIIQLQEALSDLQVYLYQEREQVLRLYAENDKLKIRQMEDKKRIKLLMSLTNVSETELTSFLCIPSNNFIVNCKNSAGTQALKDLRENIHSRNGASEKAEGTSNHVIDPEISFLQSQALSIQLEEQTQLFQDHMQSVLRDREVSQKEAEAHRERLQEQISDLSTRLKESHDKLCDTASELVSLKEMHQRMEVEWLTEKDRMLRNIENFQEQLGEVHPPIEGYRVSGSGSNSALQKGKSTSAIQGDINSIKEQLNQRESMVCLYQDQCMMLEEELERVKSQTETNKQKFKEKTEKMAAQVVYLKNKYNELDRRRLLEAEGFRNDIKMLRSRLRDVERTLYKVSNAVASSLSARSNDQLLISAARETMSKARLLEKEIKQIKNKVMGIEADLAV